MYRVLLKDTMLYLNCWYLIQKYFHVFIVTTFDVLHLTALHHLNDLQIFIYVLNHVPAFSEEGLLN